MIALSIRQPWAWLIANGHKDIENRTWATRFRGAFLIHASRGMTHGEYDEGFSTAMRAGMGRMYFPRFEDLDRGGIVGVATLTDVVTESQSPWFMGSKGFVVTDATPLPFFPLKGQLGFFETNLTRTDLMGQKNDN